MYERFLGRVTRHLTLFLLLFLLAMFVSPIQAMAVSYEVKSVDIDAVVGTDGTVSVTERRTYAFSGEHHGIYWDVHEGTYEGRPIVAQVQSVSFERSGARTDLVQSTDEVDGTYTQEQRDGYQRLVLYCSGSDDTVTFEVRYMLGSLATRWVDTAELYWQYVPRDESSGEEWHDVTATVHLPVPAGEHIDSGENVRAWGHGPLDGEVSFVKNAIVFYSPGVGSSEFLEARVAFPAGWLQDVRAKDEVRLETILDEEKKWAKDANARRRRARLVTYGMPGIMGLSGLVTTGLAIAYMKGFRFRKKRVAGFTDTYFRDVPSTDHPAVLGMLYHNGRISGTEFTATLMRLVDTGRVGLDTVLNEVTTDRRAHATKKQRREYRLSRRNPTQARRSNLLAADNRGRGIDDAAFRFLFDTVAAHHYQSRDLMGRDGEPYVLTSFFNEVADDWPDAYGKGFDAWDKAVRKAYYGREFEVEGQSEGGIYPGILGFLDVAVSVVLGLLGSILGVPNMLLLPALLICFGAGIFCILNNDDESTPSYSEEALELKAKLEALGRWFDDFTRLREAIPTDVVLWNRLLVMAAAMGKSKKVVEQLRVHMPQLLVDPDLSVGVWFEQDREDRLLDPASALTSTFDKAHSTRQSHTVHEVSTSDYSSSRNSSSRGSGGGFSSGGGGGFSGGGGRGGAF